MHIAVPEELTQPLWSGIVALNSTHPHLKVCLHAIEHEFVNDMLRQGQLDLAFLEKVRAMKSSRPQLL